jgi:hypothetical protein
LAERIHAAAGTLKPQFMAADLLDPGPEFGHLSSLAKAKSS